MSRPAHVAIDLGAESGRVIVGALDDDRLALHEVHRFENGPRPHAGGLRWDVTALWRNTLGGLERAARFARDADLALASIGVDAWGVDYALLDERGALLDLPFCYRDGRAGPAFARVRETIGDAALYAATGIQLMEINTLFQLVAHRDAAPDVLARTARLLFVPDLVHFWLTGRATVEATIASTSQMIDPVTGTWATALLETLDLPTAMLAPPVAPGTAVGPVLPAVAEAAGLADAPVVIAPAAHDTASAVAAVPADEATSWCYLSSGTWSLLGAEIEAPCVTEAARRAPFTNEGGLGGTIRFLQNITGLWIVQECRRALATDGEMLDYEALVARAAAAPPLVTLIDPAHPSFLAPGRMPEKIAAFARATEQPAPVGVGALVRCGLESLALAYRRTLGQLEATLDRAFDVIHIVGGGARNALLNQMTADATGRLVRAGPDEATAAGNVLVQALGAGELAGPGDVRRVVRAGTDVRVFEPRETAAWDDAAARFDMIRVVEQPSPGPSPGSSPGPEAPP